MRALRRRIVGLVGLPPGLGILFTAATKHRLTLSVLGSVGLSLLDMLGVLATLPLFQLVAGSDPRRGALGRVAGWLGTSDPQRVVVATCVFIVGVFTLKSLLSVLFRRWQVRFLAAQQAQTSSDLLRRYLDAPYAYHLQRNPADLLRTMNDGVALGYGSIVAALSMLIEGVNLVLVFAALAVVAPVAAVATAGWFGLTAWVIQRVARERTLRAGRTVLATMDTAYRISLQSLFAVKEIKLRNQAQTYAARYGVARGRAARAAADGVVAGEAPKYVFDVVFVLGIALLAAGLFAFSPEGASPLVTLGLFVAAGSRLLPSVVRLLGAVGAIRVGRPSLVSLVKDLRELEEVEIASAVPTVGGDAGRPGGAPGEGEAGRPGGAPGEGPLSGDIAVRDVSFAYARSAAGPPSPRVLDGVSFIVSEGSSLAIVGSSGAGKSTLVDILLGLHTPDSGVVTVGGQDIRRHREQWQSSIGIVPQDVYLTDDSVRANIAFAELPEDVDDARLALAVERAQLGELVASLPEGLETWVGERGIRLSGGQRQRIGIARALYRNPTLLILDEATSALDNRTEKSVTETIAGLRGSLTVIVVAHRLSTVRDCDHLIFMGGGRIVASGTFEEVRRDSAEFAHLVALGALGPSPGA